MKHHGGRSRNTAATRCARAAALACVLCACIALTGCGTVPRTDHGANQSLIEIGENSLEQGEAHEAGGRAGEANIAYRRALWAFRYHEKLTGEQPFLLDDALDGLKRTSTPKR